jgi:hypothetical protein
MVQRIASDKKNVYGLDVQLVVVFDLADCDYSQSMSVASRRMILLSCMESEMACGTKITLHRPSTAICSMIKSVHAFDFLKAATVRRLYPNCNQTHMLF